MKYCLVLATAEKEKLNWEFIFLSQNNKLQTLKMLHYDIMCLELLNKILNEN